jgi:hypothetical protein
MSNGVRFGDQIYRAYIVKGGTPEARARKCSELVEGDPYGMIASAENEREKGFIFFDPSVGNDKTQGITVDDIRAHAGSKLLGRNFPGPFRMPEERGIIDLDA